MTPQRRLRVVLDAKRVRALRDELSRRTGHEVYQEDIAKRTGLTRALISYMETPDPPRSFRFESVFLIARYYREALKDPGITADSLALELDRLHPSLQESQAVYQPDKTETIRQLRDKLVSLPPDFLERVDDYLDFLLTQRHRPQQE